MPRSRFGTTISMSLMLIAAPLGSQTKAPLTVGFAYDVRVTSGSVDAKGRRRPDPVVEGRVRVDGADGRVDITTGDGTEFQRGDWLLTTDGGRSIFVVKPRAGTYALVDLEAAARATVQSKHVSAIVSGLVLRADTLAACEPIERHATRCFEVTATYDITIKYFLLRQSGRVRERTRYWVRTDLPTMPNPAAVFLVQSSQLGVVGDRATVERLRRLHTHLFSGAAVRLEHAQEDLDGAAVTDAQYTQIELTHVQPATHAATIFDLPVGLRRADN